MQDSSYSNNDEDPDTPVDENKTIEVGIIRLLRVNPVLPLLKTNLKVK